MSVFCQPGCEGLLRAAQDAEHWAKTKIQQDVQEKRLNTACRSALRLYLWAQTPQSVWDAYAEDGIDLLSALKMEISYL